MTTFWSFFQHLRFMMNFSLYSSVNPALTGAFICELCGNTFQTSTYACFVWRVTWNTAFRTIVVILSTTSTRRAKTEISFSTAAYGNNNRHRSSRFMTKTTKLCLAPRSVAKYSLPCGRGHGKKRGRGSYLGIDNQSDSMESVTWRRAFNISVREWH